MSKSDIHLEVGNEPACKNEIPGEAESFLQTLERTLNRRHHPGRTKVRKEPCKFRCYSLSFLI